jgi:hypothetical protein
MGGTCKMNGRYKKPEEKTPVHKPRRSLKLILKNITQWSGLDSYGLRCSSYSRGDEHPPSTESGKWFSLPK